MRNGKLAVLVCVALLSAAAVLLLVRSDGGGASGRTGAQIAREKGLLKSGSAGSRAQARAQAQREARAATRGRRAGRKTEQVRQLTPEQRRRQEQKLLVRRIFEENARADRLLGTDDRMFLDALEAAEQEGDIDFVADAAQVALKAGSSVLRAAAVESLATFGEAGLPELADYLTDPDPEIASLAVDRYEMGLQEVEDEAEVAVLAKLAALTLTDASQLDLVLSQVGMVTDELIAVQTIVDLIEEGGEETAAAARELYESYTSEEWSGIDAAENWLKENYEPEEREAPEGREEPEGDDAS